jgi:hypothetical protein
LVARVFPAPVVLAATDGVAFVVATVAVGAEGFAAATEVEVVMVDLAAALADALVADEDVAAMLAGEDFA